jgi:hypothetical protein
VDFTNETTESLRFQFTALVQSKFKRPYLEGEARKSIDEMIFKIWQELKSRESDNG